MKQEKFCLEYAKNGNATEAYKLAGYKVKSDHAAGASAARMLGNVRVQNRLQELAEKIQSKKIMGVEEMQEILTAMARGELSDEYITGDGERINRRATLKDRAKAIELLGKMQGAFVSRQEIDVKGAVPVVIRDDL